MTAPPQHNGPPNLDFSYIYDQERKEIKKRREKQSYHPDDRTRQDFVGLALSGGGIRSATFCLGFLQELHRLKLLRIFDYLSTVSGGGYLGGWWSAWLSRSEENVRDMNHELFFKREEIHNPITLVMKINEQANPVTVALYKQLKSDKVSKLFLDLDPKALEKWGEQLCETLVYHLNTYISKASDKPVIKPKDEEETKKWRNELAWQARIKLVETFPCELRNVFPPEEKIEPVRAKLGPEKSADGSRCAWEDPVHHLRLFANYLTPRKGILSADTWRAISVIIRNLTLTWLILLPLLTGVMLLGQAYFLLNWNTQAAFTSTSNPAVLSTALIQILIPVGGLTVWLILAGIAWLLCNRDNSSAQDSTVQITCLIALAVLTVYALATVDSLQTWILQLYNVKDYFFTGLRHLEPAQKGPVVTLRLLVGWAVLTITLLLLFWFARLKDREFPATDFGTLSRWKREVRRERFGRVQSQLLVAIAIVAVVLLLSLVSCFLTLDHSSDAEHSDVRAWQIPVALVPLLSALAGSIFTALRARPAANGDVSLSREPNIASRMIFAATPPLVVGVLAVIAAWFSHWLLVFYMKSNHQQFWEIRPLLKVASLLAIALCMGLAVYEMENLKWSKILKLTLGPIIFVCLLMANINWVGQAVFRYASENPSEKLKVILSVCLGGFITILVFRRIIPRGKWKWRLFRELRLVKKIEKPKKDEADKPAPILKKIQYGSVGVAILLAIALAVVGYGIGSILNTSTAPEFGLLRAGVLVLVALSGGVILFRTLINRAQRADGTNVIRLHCFTDKPFSTRPAAIWLAASISLVLPIVLINVAHYIKSCGLEHPASPPMMTFPIFVGLFLLLMMVLRVLLIQKWVLEKKEIIPWSAGIFEWLFGKTFKARQEHTLVYQLLVLFALCLQPAIEMGFRTSFAFGRELTMSVFPTDWRVSAVALMVSLPAFGAWFFQVPVKTTTYEELKVSRRKILQSQTFLWIVASLCILCAFVAGLLLPDWLTHVSEITSTEGFTRVLLPIATGCFLIAVFEFSWSKIDNRRSLNLIAFAYMATVAIFFLRLTDTGPEWQIVPGLLAAICVWVAALGWMVDPNSVSMHQFYKGRLVQAYLGASNARRLALGNKEITETVANDDLPLRHLRNCDHGGPYHLINTTLNLVAGRDLSTAQRAASSFVLSSRHCGSTRTNYCSTERYMDGQLTLGTAVAASGAAVSPNMGAKKPTAALAMLMTLLNVRLGYWAPTPNRDGWNSSQPRLWPFYLVREFLSQTNDLSDYCYLTDGGHFDNTGLYSLIERGCRYIVVVDCGADPKPSCFEDLGEAIRRCRIDFGTEIKLNLDPFINASESGGDPCFAVGKIMFAKDHLASLGVEKCDDEKSRTGRLVYFKPAVMENVTPDVRQYAIENKNFPQQPTTNQWFGEAQFESYRQLGQLCAKQAFKLDHVKEMSKSPTVSLDDIDRLFNLVGNSEGNKFQKKTFNPFEEPPVDRLLLRAAPECNTPTKPQPTKGRA